MEKNFVTLTFMKGSTVVQRWAQDRLDGLVIGGLSSWLHSLVFACLHVDEIYLFAPVFFRGIICL